MATPPGTQQYKVSAVTDWPDVSILWLGEVEGLICNFYLSVAERKLVWADASLDALACSWDAKQPINKQTAVVDLVTKAGIANEKKKRKFLGGPGACPSEFFWKSRLKSGQFEAFWWQIWVI